MPAGRHTFATVHVVVANGRVRVCGRARRPARAMWCGPSDAATSFAGERHVWKVHPEPPRVTCSNMPKLSIFPRLPHDRPGTSCSGRSSGGLAVATSDEATRLRTFRHGDRIKFAHDRCGSSPVGRQISASARAFAGQAPHTHPLTAGRSVWLNHGCRHGRRRDDNPQLRRNARSSGRRSG